MVEIKNLTKKYDGHTALNDLTVTIEEGRIYGFLGPNGAGKTTTMNIITGCLAATSGTVTIDGYDILTHPREAKKRIGYLPEQPPLYLDMTPREYLTFACGLKGIKGKDVSAQVQKAAAMTQIEDHLDRLIKHLSKGYKQRVGIAQAVLGDPKLIILDEPTVGLDPKQITEIRELIKNLGRNRTVILSSHILSEISSVCDNIMILRKGRLVACDTPENLQHTMIGEITLSVTADRKSNNLSKALSSVSGLSSFECVPSQRDEGCFEYTFRYSPELDLRHTIARLFYDEKALVLSMREVRLSLEDVFLKLTASDEEPAEPEDSREETESEEA